MFVQRRNFSFCIVLVMTSSGPFEINSEKLCLQLVTSLKRRAVRTREMDYFHTFFEIIITYDHTFFN